MYLTFKIFFMKSRIFVVILMMSSLAGYSMPLSDTATLLGRWDITVYYPGKVLPSWLEVTKSGIRTLVGRWVGTGGSARPIARV